MRPLKQRFFPTASLQRLVRQLRKQVKSLEDVVASQYQQLSELELKSEPRIHFLQVQQGAKLKLESDRRDALNDEDLRFDLEDQYGKTEWANKLIQEIITTRHERKMADDLK